MKSENYDLACVAYNAKDYPQALKLYYQCLKEEWASFGPGDAGLVYHRIGNCLIKMRNFKEAAVSYQKALQDVNYTEKTSIFVNLGTTLNGIGKYEDAVVYFNQALSDTNYATPYRAYMGLGSAYTKLGKFVEAGMAYRDAALDEGNPNPVKALTNLGQTFSLLDRPDDAAEAYLAILDFRVTGEDLRFALESLGRCYVSSGRYQEAISTFEELLSHERFDLSSEGQADYQKAQMALGRISHTTPAAAHDFSGFDETGMQSISNSGRMAILDFDEDDGYGAGNVPHAGDTGFFTATEDDLIEIGKLQLKKERKLQNTGLKVLLGIVIVLVLGLGAAIAAYVMGFGIPSQNTVISDFFSARAAGESVESYCIEDNYANLEAKLDGIAGSDNITVVDSVIGMSTSSALVKVTLPGGGEINYQVDLGRDVIGWKIGEVKMVFASNYQP